jgi:hypothetical protein
VSKLKSHTADIDVTCSAPWRRLNAPAAILRLITAEASGNAPRHLDRDTIAVGQVCRSTTDQ